MFEYGTNIEKYVGATSIYAGGSLRTLGGEKLSEVATLVSGELKAHPFTMLQYSSDELLLSMYRGNAACALNAEGQLAAFAQYWPYEIERDGDEFLEGKSVFEIGSWLSFSQGQGSKVFEACLAMGKMTYPDGQFIAIVEKNNQKASHILSRMGGERIGSKNTHHVKKVDNSQAEMEIYNMYNPCKK